MTCLWNGLSQADSSQQILIADSGCDQMLVTSIWRITQHTRWTITMLGAFAGRNPGYELPVVSSVAKLIDENGQAYMVITHEVLYDASPHQVESLFSVHESLMCQKNGIDDHAHCEMDIDGKPGTQKACLNSIEIPFHFDGTKCFYENHPNSTNRDVDITQSLYQWHADNTI